MAAANGGVPDRLFKKHGRWKSDSTKDGYVKDSLHARLAVSSNLGLWVTVNYLYVSFIVNLIVVHNIVAVAIL